MPGSSVLNLMPCLQSWDGNDIQLRLLALPRVNPLDPLIPAGPSFATAKFVFDVRLVAGLDTLPTTAVPSTSVIVPAPARASALALSNGLSAQFPIDPNPPPVPARSISIYKHLPQTYLDASGYAAGRTPFGVTDDRYRCALNPPPVSNPVRTPRPPIPTTVSWAKVIAAALRQKLLAEALGLTVPLTVTLPAADFFKAGGFIYVTLAPASDAYALTTLDALALYAARVPPLAGARPLFSPVFFPVASAPLGANFDDIYQEVIDYDDGFAKCVHATQSASADLLDETGTGDRPTTDTGIRLGWDDEQVAIWLNRQTDLPNTGRDAPMGVFGYRVDARELPADPNKPPGGWKSLCAAAGPVGVGMTKVGDFRGDLAVETTPSQLDGEADGTFWLPMYFVSWIGPALIAPDALTHRMMGGADPTDPGRVNPVMPEVALAYGHTYEFRVRLMDHTSGGPEAADALSNPASHPTASLAFRRFVPPAKVRLPADIPPVGDLQSIIVQRPLLGYPQYIFTGAANAVADLLADVPAASSEGRAVGLPDPDVTALQVSVQVADLAFVNGVAGEDWDTLYTTTRPFPADPAAALDLEFAWHDVHDASSLAPAPPAGPVPLPTSRLVRIILAPLCRDDPALSYFGAADVRTGPTVNLLLRKPAADERGLFLAASDADRLTAFFLQPDALPSAATTAAQQAAGAGTTAPNDAPGRLAAALGLTRSGTVFTGKPGRRTVFGTAAALHAMLAPDHSAIGFASSGDLTRRWIVSVRETIDRDWPWDGLAPAGISVRRTLAGGPEQEVGRIELVRAVNETATINPDHSQTDILFFDVIDPKPAPGAFPAEINASYRLVPTFADPPAKQDASAPVSIRLPVTTPPAQVPQLVSAGIALSLYQHSADYATTSSRQRWLWLEFDRPPDNQADRYFARVLGSAPDPELSDMPPDAAEDAPEPPLPVDPEPIRIIVPGDADDGAGLSAMDEFVAGDTSVHMIVPLPPGAGSDSPELFGFFTYEFRTGHKQGWSTAQGRFGPPLRVSGIQHPAPELTCLVARDSAAITVSAPFAQAVRGGRSLLPRKMPRSRIWVLLYVQVTQSDGVAHRNLLIGRKPALVRENVFAGLPAAGPGVRGVATWSSTEIGLQLEALGLGTAMPLSCLAVETLPASQALADPLGADLGYERILRTSPLTAIPAVC
jgi:hypothetical protein